MGAHPAQRGPGVCGHARSQVQWPVRGHEGGGEWGHRPERAPTHGRRAAPHARSAPHRRPKPGPRFLPTSSVTELLERRRTVQARFDAGEKPHFLEETKHVRVLGSGEGG